MSSRRENLKWLQYLIQSAPGFKADFYISRAAAELGLRRETVSDYLRTLVEAGKVVLRGDRFYPRASAVQSLDEDEQKHEERLLNWLRQIYKADKSVATKENKEDWYLVVYDIKNNITSAEERRIYRNLQKVSQKIVAEGGELQRIQMSVWKVRGKQNANTLASAIPQNHAKIHIFKICEE